MLNQTISFSNVLPYLSNQWNYYICYQLHESDDEKRKTLLKGRVYCTSCGKSYSVSSHVRKVKNTFDLMDGLRTMMHPIWKDETCCEKGFIPRFEKEEIKDTTTELNDWLAISQLSPLTEEVKQLLSHIDPLQTRHMESHHLEGYQLVRYHTTITIDPDTLEIQPIQLHGKRLYVYLEDGSELAYQEFSDGTIGKIAPVDFFTDDQPTQAEYLILNQVEHCKVLKQTGLLSYIKQVVQSRKTSDFRLMKQLYHYQQMRQTFPCLAVLAHNGYAQLIEPFLDQPAHESFANEALANQLFHRRGQTPAQILGYTPRVVAKIKELGGFDHPLHAQAIQKLNKEQVLTLSILESFNQEFSFMDLCHVSDFVQVLLKEGYTYEELIRYMKNHQEKSMDTMVWLVEMIQLAKLKGVSYEKFPASARTAYQQLNEQTVKPA